MDELNMRPKKPLNARAYGHIPHLPSSRMGPGDHKCHEGQELICTRSVRDKNDEVIVQEKVDGSCVAIANISGRIVPLIRAGYEAVSSKYEQHRMFAAWVFERESWFSFLNDGERIVGEWLAQAHGTRYELPHGPFVAFDIMRESKRVPFDEFIGRVYLAIPIPRLIHRGGPFSIESAMESIQVSGHGAIDPVEGCVWRVQRRGEVDFLAKWVRQDKVDGCFLPEITGAPPVWNWKP